MSDISAPQKRRKLYPSQERLRQLFDYDPEGFLIWKKRDATEFKSVNAFKSFHKRHYGKRAGVVNCIGYTQISIKYVCYLGHRLIWIWHFGEIPDGMEIDHKYGVENGNKISDLKIATTVQNKQNKRKSKNNKSGETGVCWHIRHKKWLAAVGSGGKNKYLGMFSNKEDAILAVRKYRSELGFSERHGK